MFYTTTDSRLEHQHAVCQSSHSNNSMNARELQGDEEGERAPGRRREMWPMTS